MSFAWDCITVLIILGLGKRGKKRNPSINKNFALIAPFALEHTGIP
jgi:hypothetical protein